MRYSYTLQQFNLESFFEQSRINGKFIMSPSVFIVEDLNDYPIDDVLEECTYEELLEALIEQGNYVYVNFSNSAIDPEIKCIDGKTYYYITPRVLINQNYTDPL